MESLPEGPIPQTIPTASEEASHCSSAHQGRPGWAGQSGGGDALRCEKLVGCRGQREGQHCKAGHTRKRGTAVGTGEGTCRMHLRVDGPPDPPSLPSPSLPSPPISPFLRSLSPSVSLILPSTLAVSSRTCPPLPSSLAPAAGWGQAHPGHSHEVVPPGCWGGTASLRPAEQTARLAFAPQVYTGQGGQYLGRRAAGGACWGRGRGCRVGAGDPPGGSRWPRLRRPCRGAQGTRCLWRRPLSAVTSCSLLGCRWPATYKAGLHPAQGQEGREEEGGGEGPPSTCGLSLRVELAGPPLGRPFPTWGTGGLHANVHRPSP